MNCHYYIYPYYYTMKLHNNRTLYRKVYLPWLQVWRVFRYWFVWEYQYKSVADSSYSLPSGEGTCHSNVPPPRHSAMGVDEVAVPRFALRTYQIVAVHQRVFDLLAPSCVWPFPSIAISPSWPVLPLVGYPVGMVSQCALAVRKDINIADLTQRMCYRPSAYVRLSITWTYERARCYLGGVCSPAVAGKKCPSSYFGDFRPEQKSTLSSSLAHQ
jgi:hypothetical protein